jgi:hypothetical protein
VDDGPSSPRSQHCVPSQQPVFRLCGLAVQILAAGTGWLGAMGRLGFNSGRRGVDRIELKEPAEPPPFVKASGE